MAAVNFGTKNELAVTNPEAVMFPDAVMCVSDSVPSFVGADPLPICALSPYIVPLELILRLLFRHYY